MLTAVKFPMAAIQTAQTDAVFKICAYGMFLSSSFEHSLLPTAIFLSSTGPTNGCFPESRALSFERDRPTWAVSVEQEEDREYDH